jgi:hypothetical protein
MGKNKKGKKKRSKNVEGIVSDDHVASASVSNEEKKASLEDVSANENSTYDQSSKSSKKRKRVKEIPDPEGHDAKGKILLSIYLQNICMIRSRLGQIFTTIQVGQFSC